jgi:chemotaxis signal transduction protein
MPHEPTDLTAEPLPDWLVGPDMATPEFPEEDAPDFAWAELPMPEMGLPVETMWSSAAPVLTTTPLPVARTTAKSISSKSTFDFELPALVEKPKPKAPLLGNTVLKTNTARLDARVEMSSNRTKLNVLTDVKVPNGQIWMDVTVTLPKPDGLSTVEANRKPSARGSFITWNLGTLASGTRVPLKLAIPNNEAGQDYIHPAPKFELRYIVQAVPKLDCQLSGPATLSPGQQFTIQAVFHNTGAVPFHGLTLVKVAADGNGSTICHQLEHLDVGERQTVEIAATSPLEPGIALWQFRVNGGPWADRPILFTSDVQAPILVDALMPTEMFLDDVEPFRLRIENPSTRAMTGLKVSLSVPVELRFDSSDGRYEAITDVVTWTIDELPIGDIRTYTAWLKSNLPGSFRVTCTVTSNQGETLIEAAGTCRMKASTTVSKPLAKVMAELDQVADDERLEASRSLVATGTRHILFRLGEGVYAAPLEHLTEVIRVPHTSPVPDAPDWFLGLANVRGEVTSMIDLPGLFRFESASSTTRSVLVARTADETVTAGLVVEEVLGIRRMSVTPWNQGDTSDWGLLGPFLSDVSTQNDQLIPVLNLRQLLESNVLQVFDTAA